MKRQHKDPRWLLIATLGVAACASRSEPGGFLDEAGEPKSASVAAAETCQPVTSISVVHKVNGSNVTTKLRLDPDSAAVPDLALRSLRSVAVTYGEANIVSSKLVSELYCAPQGASLRKVGARFDGTPTGLCASPFGQIPCDELDPTHIYNTGGTESCTMAVSQDASTVRCEDSSAIVTKHGDVVLTINTQNLRQDALAKTQVLRKFLGDASIITNFHFDVVVTPEQQASIVGNEAFTNIANQIQQASQLGQPLPDVQQILHDLPTPPQNVDFYVQLMAAYQKKLERLGMLAQVMDGKLLSEQQVNAFLQSFVEKSKLVDKLEVGNTPSGLDQACDIIDESITDLSTADPSSTIYDQVKAGAESMLEAHTEDGIYDPEHKVDFVPPKMFESLTDEDIEKQLIASDLLNDLNQQLRHADGAKRAHDMNAGMSGIPDAMAKGDMEKAYRLYDRVKATEFFFDHTDPRGTSYDVRLSPQAQAMFNITVLPSSAAAYEVIVVLNETASYNAATNQVTVDYKAVITLNARGALDTNSVYRAAFHTEEAWGTLSFLKNLGNVGGAVAGGYLASLAADSIGILVGLKEGWSELSQVKEHLEGAVANWHGTMEEVLRQGLDVLRQWPNMTPAQTSELIARISAQIVQSIPPEVLASSGAQEAIEAAVRLHLDMASRGLAIVEQSGVALQEDAAVELVKQLESMEVTDLDESIKIADVVDDFVPCDMVRHVAGSFTGRGAVLAADEPPCGPTDIAQAFEKARAQAAKLGFSDPKDVHDLMRSLQTDWPRNLIKQEMDPKELSFANKILDREGGTMVGNRVFNRAAIDGFFKGEPIQLKTHDIAQNLDTVKKFMVDARAAVIKEKLRGVRLFHKVDLFTRDEIVAYIQQPWNTILSMPKPGGSIRSIDILTSDGFWLHVENGVIR